MPAFGRIEPNDIALVKYMTLPVMRHENYWSTDRRFRRQPESPEKCAAFPKGGSLS